MYFVRLLKSITTCNCRSHCCSSATLVWNIGKFRAKKYFTDHWTAKTLKLQSVFNVFLAQRYTESPLPVVQCCAKSGKAASGSGEFQFCNKHWIRWQSVRVSQFLWQIVGVAIIGNFCTGLYFFWTSRGEGKFPRGLLINITNSFFFAHH